MSEKAAQGLDSRGKALDKLRQRSADTLMYMEVLLDKRYDEMFELRSITIKAPNTESNEWFGIIRATDEGRHIVGFHGGATLLEVLTGIVNRIDNRSMKWKDDEYA